MRIGPGRRLFQLHRYKVLLARLAIIVGADILFLSGVIVWFRANPGFLIFRGAVPASLMAINLALAIAYRFVSPKFYMVFLINSIFSVLIFYLLLNLLRA